MLEGRPVPSPGPAAPVPTPGPLARLSTEHASRLLGGRRNVSDQEVLAALWAAEWNGTAGTNPFTHVDFLGGFESPDWPKSPQCGNHPGLRQAPNVRVRERGDRLTKLVHKSRRLEVRHIRLQPLSHTVTASITYGYSLHHVRLPSPSHKVTPQVRKVLKSGSMMIKDILDCLQPDQWEEVSQAQPTKPDFEVHALVRPPQSHRQPASQSVRHNHTPTNGAHGHGHRQGHGHGHGSTYIGGGSYNIYDGWIYTLGAASPQSL